MKGMANGVLPGGDGWGWTARGWEGGGHQRRSGEERPGSDDYDVVWDLQCLQGINTCDNGVEVAGRGRSVTHGPQPRPTSLTLAGEGTLRV